MPSTYRKQIRADRLFAALSLCIITASGCAEAQRQSEADYQELRKKMVEQQLMRSIFGRTPVTDPAVLAAMRVVPRHRFVPDNMRDNAYVDSPLPIGEGQTISQPYIVARMTELLDVDEDDVVLEVGTGSGYQAAVLGEIVRDVYSIEIVPELGRRAADTLRSLGYDNVHTKIGDGYIGWPEHAPFDGIIVTAAPDHVPQPLIEQLARGGRMVIPVGPEGGIQELLLIDKNEEGAIGRRMVEAVRFVPLTGDRADGNRNPEE